MPRNINKLNWQNCSKYSSSLIFVCMIKPKSNAVVLSFPEILLALYISRFVCERSLQYGNTSGKEQKNPQENPTLGSYKTEIF